MGLGAWFAAIAAGYAVDWFIAAAPAGRNRTLTCGACVVALVFPVSLGARQSWEFSTDWPNSTGFIAILRPLADNSNGRLLVEDPDHRRVLPARWEPMAAMVKHPEHRLAIRGQHWRPEPERRRGRSLATQAPSQSTSSRITSLWSR